MVIEEHQALPFMSLLTALFFPLAGLGMVELLKVGYRRQRSPLLELRRYHAQAASRGFLDSWSPNVDVRDFREKHPALMEIELPAV